MEIKTKTAEHVLVCLSSSPSNAKLVKTAAKMAKAFNAEFTALYVKNTDGKTTSEDERRLRNSIELAEQFGAGVATVTGDDVAYQIAEYARLCGITKIVIGRTRRQRRSVFQKPSLVEQLTELVFDAEIYIIPDISAEKDLRRSKLKFNPKWLPCWKDIPISALLLLLATLLGVILYECNINVANAMTLYLLAVLFISAFTRGYVCGIIGSVLSVLMFNYFFTEPRFTFHAYDAGYPVTFVIMLITSILAGAVTSKLKEHAKVSAQTAYRANILFETNRLLKDIGGEEKILDVMSSQLVKLLKRSITVYAEIDGKIVKYGEFTEDRVDKSNLAVPSAAVLNLADCKTDKNKYLIESFTTNSQECFTLTVNGNIYGAVGVDVSVKSLDTFEISVARAILGEGALAIQNVRVAKQKESVELQAKNEQLRADLLRSISHDLRTPLTSISGNAANLLANDVNLDRQTKMQIYNDIYDDSLWLIRLVENLLSITRLEDGNVKLNMSVEPVDEVIEEALRHVNRKIKDRKIVVHYNEDIVLAKMDARLIMQVIVNIVDNAVKYTPCGSTITVESEVCGDKVAVKIVDDGNGIPDEQKTRVFEMFYTGERLADGRRSLGLGLALCKTIVAAHGGNIAVSDNKPHGCVFTFTLPLGESKYDE